MSSNGLEKQVFTTMMASIELGNGQRLELEPVRDVLQLTPAVAGAQLELVLRVIAAGGQAATDRFAIAAAVYVSRRSQQGRRLLCWVQAKHTVTATARGTEVRLVGLVSDHQLRVVEELRAGGDLWLGLAIDVSTVAGSPPGLSSWNADLNFPVRAGEWAGELERVDAAAFVEVLVPVPLGEDLAGAVQRLREARALLRDDQVDAALGAARKALEPVLAAVREGGLAKDAAAKPARQRNLDERFAVLVEATFSLLSGSAHDDEVTAGFRYSREEAVTLVATTAGLVKRLAASRT